MITPHATSARPLPFLAESRTRFFRQMRDRFLLRGRSGFLDVRFRGGSLFLACHILGVPLLMGQNPGLQARFGNLDRPSRFLCPPAAQVLRPRRLASRQGSMTPRSGWFVPCDEFFRLLRHFKKMLIDVHATSSRARRRPRLLGTKGPCWAKRFLGKDRRRVVQRAWLTLGDFLKQRLCFLFHSPLCSRMACHTAGVRGRFELCTLWRNIRNPIRRTHSKNGQPSHDRPKPKRKLARLREAKSRPATIQRRP
jgi:hypothetical protein